MPHIKNKYNNLLVIAFISIAIVSCNNSVEKSYCVDSDVCYQTVYSNKTFSDSIRFIFYKKSEIGKEIFIKGELDSIIINDLNKLKKYYSEYRHMQYVGQSLFTSRCFGCHNFYPDIIYDLKITDSLNLNKMKYIIENTHGKIKLNEIEIEAIYEYIRPKTNIILPDSVAL